MLSVETSIYASYGGRDKFHEKKTNLKLIKENVPLEDQKNAIEAYENFEKIPNENLDNDMEKAKIISDKSKLVGKLSKALPKHGPSNAHALVNDKLGQFAVDVGDKTAETRGLKRMIFDRDPITKATKFADYTKNHNYKRTNNYGKNDHYHKCHEAIVATDDVKLTATQHLINLKNNLTENDDEDEIAKQKKDV